MTAFWALEITEEFSDFLNVDFSQGIFAPQWELSNSEVHPYPGQCCARFAVYKTRPSSFVSIFDV